MAEKKNVTRKQALQFAINIIRHAVECGITEPDGVAETEVLESMLDQLNKPRKATVSKARLMNENLARALAEKADGEITTKDAVAFGIPEIGTTQKAAAVLRVATELGLFEKVAEGKRVAYRKVIAE
jgi:hypothetical protein